MSSLSFTARRSWAAGSHKNGFVAELHWYPEKATATAMLYNVGPGVPGVSDLVPQIVLGVPPAATK